MSWSAWRNCAIGAHPADARGNRAHGRGAALADGLSFRSRVSSRGARVNLGSLWAAFDADVDVRLKRLKITRRAFNARKLQGLRIITSELIRRRVPFANPAQPCQSPWHGARQRSAPRGRRLSRRIGIRRPCGDSRLRGAQIATVGDGARPSGGVGDPVAAQWWCRRATDAQRVAAAATARLRRLKSRDGRCSPSAIGRRLRQAIFRGDRARRETPSRHALFRRRNFRRRRTSIARVDEEIETLQRAGQLKSVNRSYRAYRTKPRRAARKRRPMRIGSTNIGLILCVSSRPRCARSENHASAPGIARRRAFLDRQQQKFFTEEIQGDGTRLACRPDSAFDIAVLVRHLSRACGPCKTAPAAPSTSFHSRQQHRRR